MKKLSLKSLKRVISAFVATVLVLGTIPAGVVFGAPETEYRNVLEGVAYKTSIASHTSYPDAGGELTDGKEPGFSFYDGGWTAFKGISAGSTSDITVELDDVYEIDKFAVYTLNSRNSGGIGYPQGEFVFSYSTDGIEYKVAYKGAIPEDAPENTTYIFEIPLDVPVEAQYIRVGIPAASGWSFIGEIYAYADAPVKPLTPYIESDLVTLKNVDEGDSFTLSVEAYKSDSGVLSYQWYKDGEEVGTNSDTLTVDAAAVADSGEYYVEVRNTLNGFTKTVKSSVCEVIVFPTGLDLQKPSITMNLPATMSANAKEPVILYIGATSTDGGVLSYQWYKDGVAFGTNTDTIVIDSAKVSDSGKYKVVITNTKEGYSDSIESAECTLTVAAVQSTNVMRGETYTTNGTFHGTYKDTSYTKLTDGNKTTSWNSGTGYSVGFKGAGGMLQIAFDNFTTEKTFKEIQIGVMNDKKSGIGIPGTVHIEGFIGGEWTKLFEGNIDSEGAGSKYFLVFVAKDNVPITANGLRFKFSNITNWTFIDEIYAYTEDTGETPHGYMEESVENNIALGKSYTVSASAGPNYPDTDGKELTDGVSSSSTEWKAAPWSGYNAKVPVDFIFDLGEKMTFEEIHAGFLWSSSGAIRGTRTFEVYASNDKEKWEKLGADNISGFPTGNYIFSHKMTMYKPVDAQYVKITMSPDGWLFLDEIKILAKSEDNPDASSNNLAKKKEYTSNNSADVEKLTNTKRGAFNSDDGGWVEYTTDAEIVIDLETVRDFKQIEARFLSDKENGYNFPEEVQVSFSDDKADWSAPEKVAITDTEATDAVATKAQFVWPEGKSARYVKVTFPVNGKVLIDEIEVLKEQTVFSQDADEVYVDTNNIALNASYTTAWDAGSTNPDTDKKELTDGIRGTALYSEEAWSGYDASSYQEEAKDGSFYTKYHDFSVTLDLGEAKTFEQVQVGVLASSTKQMTINAPSVIKVEYSNNGTSWKLFTIDENVSAELGVNRFNYYMNTAVTAQYVKVTMSSESAIYLDEISVYKEAMPHGDYELNPDEGATFNLLLGNAYAVSRPADYRSTPGLFTDGMYMQSGTLFDGNWSGFKKNEDESKNTVEVTFDMGKFNSISEFSLTTRNDAANNIAAPQNVTFYCSSDGSNWSAIYTAPYNDAQGDVEFKWDSSIVFNSFIEGATEVYARYLKVSFETVEDEDIYVAVDEIKAFGKRGRTSKASEVVSSSGYYNLVLGKPYTSYPVQDRDNTQPDIGLKQLTDGIYGVDDTNDPAWVKYTEGYKVVADDPSTSQQNQSIIFEFDEVKSIASIKLNSKATGFGGVSEHPWTVFTYASMDGVNWYPLSRQWYYQRCWWGGICTWGWRIESQGIRDLVDSSVPAVAARYVRVDIEMVRTNMIDEIEVYGYDGKIEGAIDANGTRNLDTGRDYQKPDEETNYINDLVLCYNGHYAYNAATDSFRGNWTKERFRTYLTYVDTNNKVLDTMYDAVCLLGLRTPSGTAYNKDVGTSYWGPTADDWYWYLDKTFKDGGDVDELNEAARIAREELMEIDAEKYKDYKIKLVVMHPGAARVSTTDPNSLKFGPLDGKYYNWTVVDQYDPNVRNDWQECVDWWFYEVLERFAAGNYEYIDFSGFYYLGEQVGYIPSYHMYFNNKAHELGYKTYWIPFQYANGYFILDDIGYDAVAIQPNHFFGDMYTPNSREEVGNNWLDAVARDANYAQAGLEMEFDNRVFEDPHRYNLWLDYLNGAVRNGMDGDNAYRAWYQAVEGIHQGAIATNSIHRSVYDYSYQLIKGTYTEKEPIESFSEGTTIDNKIGTYGVNQNLHSGGAGGGGGVYYDDSKEDIVETATPSEEGYTWFTATNGYKLKDAEGNFVTGWAEVNGDWYYLGTDGYLTTGWVKDQNTWYYLKSNGVMADDGWYKVDNVWYYFGNSGAMKTGWVLDNGRWYYMMSSGAMASGQWVLDKGNWYYFLGNGAMATGWVLYNNDWYYLNESGAMAIGWKLVKGDWYYLDPANGKMAKNTTVDGYKLGADGAWVK